MRYDRRLLAFAVASVVLVAAVLVAVVAGRPSIAAVRSADGRASLSIDPGALPSGVSMADVRILSVSSDRVPPAPGVVHIAAYELVPDGLQLRAPAKLSLALGLDAPPALLFGLHIAKDQWELLDTETTKWDADSRSLTIATSVSHFSSLFYYRDQLGRPGPMTELDFDPIAVTLSAPTVPVAVGSSFQVAATVRSSASIGRAVASITYPPPFRGAPLTLVPERLWSFTGNFTAQRPFSPSSIRGVPLSGTLDGTFTTLQTFLCERPGRDVVAYGIEAQLDVNVLSQPASGSIHTFVTATRLVECVGDGATPTTTPSPSSQATARPTGTTIPSSTGTGRAIVCGLPGGPTCPPGRP